MLCDHVNMKNVLDRLSKEMAYAARIFSLGTREIFRSPKSNKTKKQEEVLYVVLIPACIHFMWKSNQTFIWISANIGL